MITGKVVNDAIFVNDSSFILNYENELKVVKTATAINRAKITFKLPENWKAFKKVVCARCGEKVEYIPLNNDSCQLPSKFNGCSGIVLKLIVKNETGKLFDTNEVKLN